MMNAVEEYPLKHSVILDPASTISITNTDDRLVNSRPATHDDHMFSGDLRLPVTAYGTMLARTGNTILHLENVALCPRILTTLVSLRPLRKRGMFWDNEHDPTTLRRRDKLILCPLKDIHGQWALPGASPGGLRYRHLPAAATCVCLLRLMHLWVLFSSIWMPSTPSPAHSVSSSYHRTHSTMASTYHICGVSSSCGESSINSKTRCKPCYQYFKSH